MAPPAFRLFGHRLAQRAIHHLGNKGLACLGRHAVAETAADIRHFEALDTIVSYVGHQLNIVNVELAVELSVGINLAEQLYLVLVKVFSYLLNHPYISEKGRAKIAVAHHGLLNHVQMGVNKLDNLVLRTYFFEATSSILSESRSSSDSITA